MVRCTIFKIAVLLNLQKIATLLSVWTLMTAWRPLYHLFTGFVRRHMCCRAIKTKLIGVTARAYQCLLIWTNFKRVTFKNIIIKFMYLVVFDFCLGNICSDLTWRTLVEEGKELQQPLVN